MKTIEKIHHTGKTHTKLNRDPAFQRDELNALDIKLSAEDGKNYEFIATDLHPTAEQLFAGAWSACWITVLNTIAEKKRITLPDDTTVDLHVSIGDAGPTMALGAKFTLRAPGLDQAAAEGLAHAAHQFCPYSLATKGNIEVLTEVITA